MKIALISNLYPPFLRGGAEVVVFRTASGLRQHLQHVFVITSRPFTSLQSLGTERVFINDVPVYRFFPLNIFYYLDDYLFPWLLRAIWHIVDIFNIHSALAVWRVLRREKPDVVITHNLTGIGFLIPRVIHRLGYFHIHVTHDVQLYNPSGIIITGKEHSFSQQLYVLFGYTRIMRWLFAKTDVVISPSQFLLSFYRSRGFFSRSKTVVVANPVSIPEEPPQHTSSSHFRLLFLGQIVAQKGIQLLIDVVRSLPYTHIDLKVIGVGPLLSKLVEAVPQDKRIRFYGWQSQQAIAAFFSTSDVLVVPTLCYDNSPTVIFEALSYGIPVVASHIGGIPEIIHEGVNGWLFKPGDKDSLKRVIVRLIEHRDAVARASRKAVDSVKRFSIDSFIEALLEISDR